MGADVDTLELAIPAAFDAFSVSSQMLLSEVTCTGPSCTRPCSSGQGRFGSKEMSATLHPRWRIELVSDIARHLPDLYTMRLVEFGPGSSAFWPMSDLGLGHYEDVTCLVWGTRKQAMSLLGRR